MRGSQFIFDGIDLLYYHLQNVSLKRSGSYINSPEWLKNKKATKIHKILMIIQGCRENGGSWGASTPIPTPHYFLEQKCFFHVKSENIKFA